MSRQNLVFDPSSKQWVPGETPRTMGVPFEGPVNHPLEVRVAALEQGMDGGDGGDTGKGFPYGSQWWMGYTTHPTGVTIHNVLLHYNRGVIPGSPSVFFPLSAGAIPLILGFFLDLSTGLFEPVTTTTLDDFTQQGDGDELFRFPVYRFLATTSATPGELSVEMLSDYVHGSNLGGL